MFIFEKAAFASCHASTIVDLSDEVSRWRIIREGAIPAVEISGFFAKG